MKKIICILAMSILLVGCDNHSNNDSYVSVKQFQSIVLNLDNRVSSLESQVISLNKHQIDMYLQLFAMKNNSVSFSPSDSGGGYQVVNTNVGHLVVLLDKISKYADGYKVRFRIGNPSLATINKYNVQIKWGKAFDKGDDFTKWNNSMQMKEINLTRPIYPGRWNNIVFILSPAKSSQTGYINLTINVSGIVLERDFR